MIHTDIDQGSAEWFALRRGRVTGSCIADVMAKGQGKTRDSYMAKLLCERLTGETEESFQSADMLRGKEMEPAGRATYTLTTGLDVLQVAFVEHPDIDLAGCSPDGLIGDDGGLELKCPKVTTHIDTLQTGKIPGNYMKQIQWNMACTGRRWWDYASYNGTLPYEMRMFIKRVPRDLGMILEIETEVRAFLRELDQMEADLRAKFMVAA